LQRSSYLFIGLYYYLYRVSHPGNKVPIRDKAKTTYEVVFQQIEIALTLKYSRDFCIGNLPVMRLIALVRRDGTILNSVAAHGLCILRTCDIQHMILNITTISQYHISHLGRVCVPNEPDGSIR